MSIKLMTAVWEREDISATEALVLLALADHANDDGNCYPSVGRLSKRCKMSDRGVQKIVQRLVERGLLEVDLQAGKRGANVFQLHLTPEPGSPPNRVHPRTGFTPPPNEVHPTPEPGSPEPLGTIKEPSRARRAPARTREGASQGFDAFWRVHPRAKSREASERAFEEAVRSGVEPARIVAAAERYRAEKGDEAKQYLCPSDEWLRQRRWEGHHEAGSDSQSEAGGDVIAFWAGKVNDGSHVPIAAISCGQAREMVRRGLVTESKLRAMGVSI